MTHQFARRRTRLGALAASILALLLFATVSMHAQDESETIKGTVLDASDAPVANATVIATNSKTGAQKTVQADGSGNYSIDGLPSGTYSLDASANGFTVIPKSGIALSAGQSLQMNLAMKLTAVTEEVTVNAGVDSMAVKSAPSGGYLEERSARSLVSDTYIENYTSPMADYGELVQVVPGAFTTSSNGVGLGQSKTYFRGFPDGDYDIDFDGIPFYDTNTPSHHSWSFFPVQWIGGVDFDRSPGSAATIGPTPFGGTIHYLSKPLTSDQDYRVSGSYGTWNTKLFDGAFNSGSFGLFGGAPKSNMYVDVHHMSSDGYQTFNFNLRSAGSLLYQYAFSPKTVFTAFTGVVHLNSNGPNISSTNCMLFGARPAYGTTCANADTANQLQPFTGAGIKFLLTDNSNPASWFNYNYNRYQVYTDFEYLGLKSDLGKGWFTELKGYTLNYDNGELYSNATPITELTNAAVVSNPSLIPGSVVVGSGSKATAYFDGAAVAPCNVGVAKKGVTAIPCGIDKYNSYRKYGETMAFTQTSHLGVFRAGFWYEWAKTNRHQYPSDPLNNWADQPLPKFNEHYWTNSYQPYAEYEFHVGPKLNITAGGKFAGYKIMVLHFADDGATVGELGCASTTAACPNTAINHGVFTAWLPSLDVNYRLFSRMSVYAQGATGSVVPPSAVYDYNQTAANASIAVPQLATPPKQQKSTTYQIGSVFKGNRFTFDADAFRVRFQNSYSSTIDNIAGDVDLGDTIFYLQPSSITEGIEFETTVVLIPGLNLYLNGTVDNAYYSGSLNAGTQTAPYYEHAPSGLWVAQTPTDTEMEGLTYEKAGFNLGMFNKRIGDERIDNGQYHNQAIVPEFSSLGAYVNYTVRGRSMFDQTKIRLSATNLLDAHNVQSNSLTASPLTTTIPGTSLTDQFRTLGPTPVSGQDTPSLMAGRSFSVSVTFGISPEGKGKK